MYIKPSRTYYTASGEQHASRAPFLVVFSDGTKDESGTEILYACVRQVALSQCGQWMMGHARILGHSFTMSGGLGGDGLPKSFRKCVPTDTGDYTTVDLSSDAIAQLKARALTPIPSDLAKAYWADDTGWNSVGTSGGAIRQWALTNLASLSKSR